MAVAGPIIMAVGLAMQAYSSYQQAQQQKAAGKAEQEAANYNAKILENEAVAKRQEASTNAEDIRSRNAAVLAEQRARFGASGLSTTSGTPLYVMADTAAKGELDALRILHAGELEATGLQSSAGMQRWQGEIARQTSKAKARTTLLTGAGKMLQSAGSMKFGGGAATQNFGQAYGDT